ncbi:putative zinc finger protein [Operophtera brumata]|uniref:Putative zinc finger protein n=1 Tax=Operophtera brumata TaxID=104452 RepID=A0A0L7LPE8_OPEBR|nr:putative zinc finger protein [Operophtera brumata]
MELKTPDSPKFNPNNSLKTYLKTCRKIDVEPTKQVEELTTKNAVTFLVAGTIPSKVCKYCLNVTEELYELERVMEIGSKGGLYSVTVRDMIASFHPFKQCDQAERAIVNCFEDINSKLSKLDPIGAEKQKRGRKKKRYNYDKIEVQHSNVIDYADPVMHIVNTASESSSTEPALNPLECLKCCQVLPTIESLVNHSKIHPKSMWYNCRLCGKSFPKLYLVKRHYREHECDYLKPTAEVEEKKFECKQCGETNKLYYKHIQHLEKHQFKMVIDHLVHRKMDKLCSICLDKGSLAPLNKMVCIHGGPPELMGDRTMQSILGSTLPEMNFLNNYTGSKICEKCVNSAITSYTFMSHAYFVRDRLNTCITHMLDSLKSITPENNLCIEIAKNTIMPIKEPVDEAIYDDDIDDDDGTDDENKEDFLEDEYRVKSENESESELEIKPIAKWQVVDYNNRHSKDEQATDAKYLNGYQMDVCSEFLTFNKKPKLRKINKKFTCPKCNKHFISEYFVKRHILKHISTKVKCGPCGTKFGNKFSLNEHTKYAHVLFQSDYRACKTCGRGFAKAHKLKHHEKQHRNKVCPLCDKIFKTQSYFDTHMQRHVPKLIVLNKKYEQSCSFCEKECSNDNQLSLHVNKVHLQIKPYSCDMCDKQFYTAYNLRYHKKIHSKFSKEKCNICSKTLKSRKLLVIHIRKHIGATPHICQICNQSYYLQTKLKKHMNLTHGGTFLCKVCKHVSVSKNELKKHVDKAHSFL